MSTRNTSVSEDELRNLLDARGFFGMTRSCKIGWVDICNQLMKSNDQLILDNTRLQEQLAVLNSEQRSNQDSVTQLKPAHGIRGNND